MNRSIVLLAAILCGGIAQGHADVLYTTPGYGTSPTNSWKDSYFADPFVLGTASTLTSVTFELTMRNDLGLSVPSTLDVGIISDNSNAPGSVLFSDAAASVASSQDDGVWSLATNFDVWELTVNTTPLNLSGATQYWLVLGLPGTGKVFWASTDTSNHQTYYSGDTYLTGNVAGPYSVLDDSSQFQYQLQGSATVPEPMSLILIASGIAGMLGVSRHKISG